MQEILQQVYESYLQERMDVLDMLPVYVWFRDLNNKYVACNKLMAYSLGFSSPEEVIKAPDIFRMHMPKHLTDIIQNNDRKVISERCTMNFTEPMLNANGEIVECYSLKAPMIHQNGEVVGVVGIGIIQREPEPRDLLSQKELDCLKFLAKGRRYKEIGRYVGISERTVRYHICNVKAKLGIKTLGGLVDYYYQKYGEAIL